MNPRTRYALATAATVTVLVVGLVKQAPLVAVIVLTAVAWVVDYIGVVPRRAPETRSLRQVERIPSCTAPLREPIPSRVKMYVWQRDQERCVQCASNEKLEYDHIISLSKGGSNTDRNFQLLCERRNRRKGSSIV